VRCDRSRTDDGPAFVAVALAPDGHPVPVLKWISAELPSTGPLVFTATL
jgi:hypothetical protein